MESTGLPSKIHLSSATYKLLEEIGGYICEERGLTLVKGKGEMMTYWLLGEKDKNREKRGFSSNANNDILSDVMHSQYIGNFTNENVHKS